MFNLILFVLWGCLGSSDDSFLTWLFCDSVQSKRTDKPAHSICIRPISYWSVPLTGTFVVPSCSSMKVVPVGMSRGVKKLMQERFPNMNKFEDISELLIKWACSLSGAIPTPEGGTALQTVPLLFVHRGANLSESEAEQDGEHNITELPQVCSGRGNMASQQSAVRLTEVSVSSQWGRNTRGNLLTIPERHLNLLRVSAPDWSPHDSATHQGSRGHGGGEHPLPRDQWVMTTLYSAHFSRNLVYVMRQPVWFPWFLHNKK